MKYLIGIDIGTSGTKSILMDADGKLIASATAQYPLQQPQNGWAEQDPEDWWEAVCTTLRSITKKGSQRGDRRDRTIRTDAQPGYAGQRK